MHLNCKEQVIIKEIIKKTSKELLLKKKIVYYIDMMIKLSLILIVRKNKQSAINKLINLHSVSQQIC